MRFPIGLIPNERNDKLRSDNAYDVFATLRHIELHLKKAVAVVYPPRSIQYDDDSKQAGTKTSIFPDIAKGVKNSEN